MQLRTNSTFTCGHGTTGIFRDISTILKDIMLPCNITTFQQLFNSQPRLCEMSEVKISSRYKLLTMASAAHAAIINFKEFFIGVKTDTDLKAMVLKIFL